MPLILYHLGFPVSADFFDEPVTSAPSRSSEDDLPPRIDVTDAPECVAATDATATGPERESIDSTPEIPIPASFDLGAIRRVIGESQHRPEDLHIPQPGLVQAQAKSTPPPVAWPTISAPQSPFPLSEDLTPPHDGVVSNRIQNILGSLNTRFASTLSLRGGGAGDDNDKAGISEDDDVVRSTSTFNSPRNSPGISSSAADEPIWISNEESGKLDRYNWRSETHLGCRATCFRVRRLTSLIGLTQRYVIASASLSFGRWMGQ
ncbi:hypothetical protein BKA82DRAFT_34902 [Pisolithus tinctorius]|uniref:Uncharacterized protein n=1 Tax=Pisolithus tinctorius Marx 270 TaxID=870435 RepID=A0A0C3IBX4_PISTI|nr:hypothetical protein BKA82DRAFT_34902 [Pisolithus tinctorius]KIN94562.1 hypothetical protein M404DRAFT_34902 [Pisolithus tinctorius Marx 270]